ncbi:hypothetical protein [Micromonospora sp. NPDC005979]|uniref:hypothetical protein n=1 Tax=unclassified Micromonospora TaxID=2617518 RepID=UPI00339E9769
MSGRRLGRSLGSLLVLAAVLGGLIGADALVSGSYVQMSDVIWGAGLGDVLWGVAAR